MSISTSFPLDQDFAPIPLYLTEVLRDFSTKRLNFRFQILISTENFVPLPHITIKNLSCCQEDFRKSFYFYRKLKPY